MRPDPLHPAEGARFLLEREAVAGDGASARYRAAIYTPDRRFELALELGMDGAVAFVPGPDSAGRELEDKLLAIARVVARGAGGRRDEGLPPWPQRLLRWRGPGR